MNPPEFFLALSAMGMFTWVVLSVVKTVGRYLEGRQSGAGREVAGLRAEVEALRADVADQADTRQHLLELEERLEFAERLLARERGPALPKGE